MQTRARREYAALRGWRIALQVKEIGSGASRRERREKLLEAARRREINVVLVWPLDPLGPVSGRSADDLPGVGAPRRRTRLTDGGAGSDHTDQVQKLYRASVTKAEIARRVRIGRTYVGRIIASN